MPSRASLELLRDILLMQVRAHSEGESMSHFLPMTAVTRDAFILGTWLMATIMFWRQP